MILLLIYKSTFEFKSDQAQTLNLNNKPLNLKSKKIQKLNSYELANLY